MDLHKTCTVVLEVVELAQRHAYECTLEVMASTKVKSLLVDFLAGIKICMYEAMCDNATCSYVRTYVSNNVHTKTANLISHNNLFF